MKFLFDFFPLIIFFVIYKIFGFYYATGAVIAATAVQLVLSWIWYKRIDPMYLIIFVLLLVFGGLTIYLHDPKFLIWKVSIVNWLIATALLASQFMKKTIFDHLFNYSNKRSGAKDVESVPPQLIRRLNFSWGIFFLLMGFVNLYVAFNYSLNIWVDFKVFGYLGLTILFCLLQLAYILYYSKKHGSHHE